MKVPIRWLRMLYVIYSSYKKLQPYVKRRGEKSYANTGGGQEMVVVVGQWQKSWFKWFFCLIPASLYELAPNLLKFFIKIFSLTYLHSHIISWLPPIFHKFFTQVFLYRASPFFYSFHLFFLNLLGFLVAGRIQGKINLGICMLQVELLQVC